SAGHGAHLCRSAGCDAPWPRSMAAAASHRFDRPAGASVMPLANGSDVAILPDTRELAVVGGTLNHPQSGDREMNRSNTMHTVPDQKIDGTPSARTWFADGDRVGYDPKARAIVAGQGAPLKVFLKREGDLAHAVSFLPGYPDGSFGWAKVLPHL